ncbi:MAG: hypothetical protein U0264_04645 [Candidatus Kapaibacterium sp.]
MQYRIFVRSEMFSIGNAGNSKLTAVPFTFGSGKSIRTLGSTLQSVYFYANTLFSPAARTVFPI